MTVVTRLPPPLPGPFATPRPDMSGRYLLRNPRIVRAFAAMDSVLALLPTNRRPIPAKIDRLLLANWAHLGDVTTTLGAVRLLRNRFPDAHLGMIVGSWGLAAAKGWGLIDTFHIVDHWQLNRAALSPSAMRTQYRRTRRTALTAIRAIGYQMAIDFYPFFPPAHPLFRRAGIPVRIGFDSGGWGPLLTHPVRWPDRDAPVAEHYGALIDAAWPSTPVAAGELRPTMRRADFPEPAGLGDGGPYIVLHPGTGAETRDWGIDRWIDLVTRLRDLPDPACRTIVVTGAGVRDVAMAAQLAQAAPWIVDRTGALGWDAFLSVLAHARLIVCPDTVVSHLGAMFDTPLICVFTGIAKANQWGPYSDAAQLLVQDVVCAPCNRWGCDAMACIRQTTAADVIAAIRGMLGDDPSCIRTRSRACH